MTGMEPIRRIVRTAQRRWDGAPAGLGIACYHLVAAGVASPTDLDSHEFEEQIAEIAQRGWTCSHAEALAALEGGVAERPRLLVTFDDAYANFGERAWPVLKRWAVPAVMYVPVDFVDGRGMPWQTWSATA
jgi:peptidoglycan/xylan/chitin deacetylase (PgdA/CDA1 family)